MLYSPTPGTVIFRWLTIFERLLVSYSYQLEPMDYLYSVKVWVYFAVDLGYHLKWHPLKLSVASFTWQYLTVTGVPLASTVNSSSGVSPWTVYQGEGHLPYLRPLQTHQHLDFFLAGLHSNSGLNQLGVGLVNLGWRSATFLLWPWAFCLLCPAFQLNCYLGNSGL